MTPYYQDSAVTIYHGDCLELLLELKCDLCFTDPPYNSGLKYGAGTDDKRLDYWDWLRLRIDQMLIHNRCVLVKHTALKITDFLRHFPQSRILVWSKPFSSGFPLNGVATHWEPIHWLSGRSCRWSKDLFECNSGSGTGEVTYGHPAQFPSKVSRWIINTFSDVGDDVLDPFMGSGTTLRAAKDLGRRAIGIEIEEKYCEIAARRMEQEVMNFSENKVANTDSFIQDVLPCG